MTGGLLHRSVNRPKGKESWGPFLQHFALAKMVPPLSIHMIVPLHFDLNL